MGNISVVSVQGGSLTAAKVIIQKGRAHLLNYKERDSSCNNMVQGGGIYAEDLCLMSDNETAAAAALQKRWR